MVSFIVEGAVLRHRVPSVVIAFERDDLFRLTRGHHRFLGGSAGLSFDFRPNFYVRVSYLQEYYCRCLV